MSMNNNNTEINQDRFKDIKQYGENQLRYGTFGDVNISIDTTTGDPASCVLTAIKTIRSATVLNENQLRKDVFNEVMALRHLGGGINDNYNKNVIPLNALFCCNKDRMSASSLSLAFPYCPLDLATLIKLHRNHTLKDMLLSEQVIRSLARDLLSGLAYCNSKGVLHTDIKPGNLLINSQGILQLADFGLAKPCPALLSSSSYPLPTRDQTFTDEAPTGLCTLYYRPPELLLGCNDYSPFVDVWSSALIIIEMMTLHPLFPGSTVIDQLARIFRIFGTPGVDHCPNLMSCPDFPKIHFTPWKPIASLSSIIPRLCESSSLLHVLTEMLQLDPFHRPTASACLTFSYFDSTHSYASPSLIVQHFLTPLSIQEPELLFTNNHTVGNSSSTSCTSNNAFNYAKQRAAQVVSTSNKLQKETCYKTIPFDKSNNLIQHIRSADYNL